MILPILKHALDALASAVGVALAMLDAANVITLLIVTYWVLRIYELPVVQRWLARGRSAPSQEGAAAPAQKGAAHDLD